MFKLVTILKDHLMYLCSNLIIATCQDHTCDDAFQSFITSIDHPSYILGNPRGGTAVCCILLLLLLRGLRQETHPSFYKRKTHDLQVICGGRTFCFSLWYKREVCIRSLGKIRLDKQIELHVETRDNDICLDKKMSWRQRQISPNHVRKCRE